MDLVTTLLRGYPPQVVRITTPSGHGTGFLTECDDEWITIATPPRM